MTDPDLPIAELELTPAPIQRQATAVQGPFGLVASPFQFIVEGHDHLQVDSFCSVTGASVAVQLRFLERETQEIKATTAVHTPNSDRTRASSLIRLAAGAVLNVRAVAAAGSPKIGQCFVIIRIVRGEGSAAVSLGTLLQGYVTAQQDLAWPGSPIQSSIEGGGVLRLITGTIPAAGGELSETVPTGARWELLCLACSFSTSAAAGDRRPMIAFVSGAIGHFLKQLPGVVAPSSGATLIWAANIGDAASGVFLRLTSQLPTGQNLLEGFQIVTTTDNMAAGDQYSNVKLLVREWLEAA